MPTRTPISSASGIAWTVALVFVFSLAPLSTNAAGGIFKDWWCGVTDWFGIHLCAATTTPPIRVTETVVTTTIPPPPQEVPNYTVTTAPGGRPVYTTVVNNEYYVSNPTTIVREGDGGGGLAVVSRDLFSKQIDAVFDGISDSVAGLGEDLATSFTTALLAVTGNASIGGNLDVVGTLSAGLLSVTGISSGGAIEAPYLTATSTTATSTLPELATTHLTLGSLTGFLKATAGSVSTGLVNLAADISGILPVANGGTGWGSLASGAILFGNGSSSVATSSALTFDGTKLSFTYASSTAFTVSGSAYFPFGTWNSSGNVGIGTTSPYRQLSVASAAVFGGDVTAATFTSTSTTATSTFAGPISTPNPVDVFDDFSGPAGAPVSGRVPVTGEYEWQASGVGYLGAYAGDGVMGTTGGNTYFIIQSSATPWEVTATFSDTDSAPGTTISVVKDFPGHGFGAMWHTNFVSGGDIVMSYWNDTWNGAASTLVNVAPTFFNQADACPTLVANTDYVARIVFNPPWVDASIETVGGQVLCTARAYDLLVENLIGPYTYIQAGDSSRIFRSFKVNDKPSSPNLLYGRSVSGLEGTPIGQLAPAAANFSSAHVGIGAPKGAFSVTWDGTAGLTPGVFSTATGGFIVGSVTSGFASTLSIKNGAGGTGTITMDGAYALSLAGNSGTAFLTKPANSAQPYFASGLGIGSSTPYARLSVKGAGSTTGVNFQTTNSSDVPLFTVVDSGSVGIGTTTPWRRLSVTGTVGFDGLTGAVGAGSLCLSANKEVVYNSGSDNCLSSTRATKHDITELATEGLAAIQRLTPVSFVYDGDATDRVRYGFIAEDTLSIDPHLVTYDASGKASGLDTSGFLATIVKAIKEFAESITTKLLNAERINTKTLCVDDTCITGTQLNELLRDAGSGPAPTTPDQTEAEASLEEQSEAVPTPPAPEEISPLPEPPTPEDEAPPITEPDTATPPAASAPPESEPALVPAAA